MSNGSRVPMVFVHHANQLIIGDGYRDRDGITGICQGYRSVLDIHRRLRVPAALHLSGTLIEAMAWHCPRFLAGVRADVADGLLTLLGGPYCEPIMPLLTPEQNHRQILAMARLLEQHLAVAGGATATAWLPERVWDPGLIPQLTHPALPGGGFTRTLVDDRLFARARSLTGPSHTEARREVDANGPYHWDGRPATEAAGSWADPHLLTPRQLPGSSRLQLVPISAHLRYLVPARTPAHLEALDVFAAGLRDRAPDPAAALLVYADDLERTAGTAGWEPALDGYLDVVRWAADPAAPVRAVALDAWLDAHPPAAGPVPDAGSYHELAVDWRAGEDYRGWSDRPDWRPYDRMLRSLANEVGAARLRIAVSPAPAQDGLIALAERLTMIGTHETAWRDRPADGGPAEIGPWVRAVASHARLARPLLAAARWSASGSRPPSACLADVDTDGEEELLLCHDRVWALVSPLEGARVSLLVHRPPAAGPPAGNRPLSGEAAVIVGNPADHWNLQEELHRFMDTPPAHPGALADPERLHLAWRAQPARLHKEAVTVDLLPATGQEADGRRRYALVTGVPALAACLRGPAYGPLECESALIPDYLGALLEGSDGVEAVGGHTWSGLASAGHRCWLGFDPQQARRIPARWQAAGHARPFAFRAPDGHLDLLLGGGAVDDDTCGRRLSLARRFLHLPDA